MVPGQKRAQAETENVATGFGDWELSDRFGAGAELFGEIGL